MVRKEFRIILLSLGISLLLTAAKFTAYFVTNSVAILSDALESIINVVAGGFACYSIYLSGKPKDANHPYGHGKVEFFSIGFEGAMIFIAGCLILFKAVQYFIHQPALEEVDQGIWITVATSAANFLLGLYLVRSGKKLPSITITGNGQHILTDAYTSVGLIVALVLIRLTGKTWIDPAASVIMGILILRKGYQLMRQSISGLMDETDMQVMDRVIGILNEHRHPAWIDVHNMRVQQYGIDYHIDCHVTMPYYLELSRAHEEMKELEQLVDRELKGHEVEFFIHIDPCIPESCQHCQLSACPVRSYPFRQRISWSRENVLPNRKHTD
ncbi:cation diffusion facilitator family transporter [Chitinophaga sp. XS-30]|uniref:cation diffusion facilitator family transporter n=1 Tax=Chitinophaga sp. XS-30 TaxID=2604421 RepID=UPI0011DCAE27|nr:cation diffusion facilitator family transporter [Chitinophaga sp. XS-30]QEH42255.1 cation transporter [Chitinophaga sp. XS-30]